MSLHHSALLSFLALSACTIADKDGDTGASSAPTIMGTFTILDAQYGSGMSGVAVASSLGETTMTDTDGSATMAVVQDGQFSVQLSKEGALDHLLFGPTGQEDFEFVTFMATEFLVDTVTSQLNTSPADGTGLLVVGIDYDNLSPAVGATASVNAAHDSPWVIGGMGRASFSNTIPNGGMGMVAFPGLLPGSVSVDVIPPQNTECTAFPSGGAMPNAPVVANTVTVITYHCR